jgi:two-component system response regulator (stage 0 sporulation protein F)
MSLKILYVDDEVDLLEIFTDMFSSSHLTIATCNKVSDVKEKINTEKPDLLLLDYRMPEMNGDKLALELSQSMSVKIPIVLVTGDIEVKTDYKFERIFKKPYDIQLMQNYFDSFKK